MSDGYTELDLDATAPPGTPGAPADDGFEIVEETVVAPSAPAVKPAAAAAEDDDDEGEDTSTEGGPRRKLSRSARLKIQRDNYAQELAALREEAAASKAALERERARNEEAAEAGYDFYEKTLVGGMEALRAEFNAAFDAGDKDKVFEVQQRMAELAAEKQQVARDRRQRPTKAAGSGSEAPPQTEPTKSSGSPQAQPPAGRPNPLATSWFEENKTWFNKDPILTAAARVIDSQLSQDGYDANEPEYFDELDKRLRAEMPHKFATGGPVEAPVKRAIPTVQNRGSNPGTSGKIKVSITDDDRTMARRLNLDIVEYAKQKYRREKAQKTASGYMEIE